MERRVGHIRIVLLSGGHGKRLWPLSSADRPKQFIPIFDDGNGARISMAQRMWGTIRRLGLGQVTRVATNERYASMLRDQIGSEAGLIMEPECRDTYAAVALTASYLRDVERTDPNETVVILPIDSYAGEDFFHALQAMDTALAESDPQLVLMGATPAYPAETYGYIVPDRSAAIEGSASLRVAQFVEKPDRAEAAALIGRQALWNCGVVAAKLGRLLSLYEEKGIPTRFELLMRQYETLPITSFDYGIVEQADHIEVIPFGGKWKDVGTWDALSEELAHAVTGAGAISDDSVNTSIVNELDVPVMALGLKDVIITAGKEGILVAARGHSARIKDLLP